MRHQNNTKKGDTKQSFNIETRNKLEGLVDEYQKEHPKSRHSWRFPTQSWAEILSKDSSTIRRELNRGKSQQGDEDHRYFVYSAHLANEKAIKNAQKKGAKSLLEKNKDNPDFQNGLNYLKDMLSRKKTLKKEEGFYSIYAAMIVTQNNVPVFKISESTIRDYLKEDKLGGLTYNDVRIMKHRNRNHEKKTTPHNVPSKIGHHISDRPDMENEITKGINLEGDTMVSKVGDNTAISSFLDRRTTFQWLVKISRETQQCFHGSLKKVIDSIPPINTITFDNGSAMSNVGKLEKIVNKGREGIKGENGEIKYETRVFYADSYCSNQRARNERNHAIIRRFIGHGKLSSISQKQLMKINDFVNDYPRRKFEGKSARQMFKEEYGVYIPPAFTEDC
jgi:IS30 family transposase